MSFYRPKFCSVHMCMYDLGAEFRIEHFRVCSIQGLRFSTHKLAPPHGFTLALLLIVSSREKFFTLDKAEWRSYKVSVLRVSHSRSASP